MLVSITPSFNKDIGKIKDKKLAERIADIITTLEAVQTISEMNGIKKLKGAPDAYRIRIGDYRFFLTNNTLLLSVFGHRKEFYRRFP